MVVVIAVVQQQLPLDDLALELKGLVPRRVSVQIVRREGGAALQYEVAQLVSPWRVERSVSVAIVSTAIASVAKGLQHEAWLGGVINR